MTIVVTVSGSLVCLPLIIGISPSITDYPIQEETDTIIIIHSEFWQNKINCVMCLYNLYVI